MTIAGLASKERRIHVTQGDHLATRDENVVLSTILGSCVSACIWDPEIRAGGLNHFLLPESPDASVQDQRYGVQAMELLINSLLRLGAQRSRLQAKLFGGGRMTAGLADIGGRNAAFAERFLRDEDIPLISKSLGGERARRIHFHPTSGRVAQQFVTNHRVPEVERAAAKTPAPVEGQGELELFS